MKKITRILGIGLTIAVLASLLVAVAPVSAGNEAFSLDSKLALIPGKIAAGTDVVDIAVAANGTTAYAALSDSTVWKTADGGNNWAKTSYAGGAPSSIAVAPDSADYVAVASGTTLNISMNGGIVFGTTAPTGGFGSAINDVAVGPAVGTARNVAVSTAGGQFFVFAPIPGDIFGGYAWNNVIDAGDDVAGVPLAASFSPSFATGDYTIVVVTANATSGYLNVYNTYFGKWNSEYALYGLTAPFGVALAATGATKADISLPGTYYGFEPLRIAYVTLDTGGLFRNGAKISPAGMYSVSYNSSTDKLVAGAVAGTTVYTVASPAAPTAVAVPSSYLKSPGGTANVTARFFGTNIGAGTYGVESAFALSSTGSTFNDVAFIDTVPAVCDLAVKSDASKFYMVTSNAGATSLWSKTTAWERVFRVTGDGWIVRPSLDNFDVVFIAQKTTNNIYYSNDAGQTTWQIRVGPAGIIDLAVETPSIIYALATGGMMKATDSGIIWMPQLVNVGAGSSITQLSASNLLIAGASGVAYTTDGGAAWSTPILTLTGALKATADKLSSGGKITAITAGAVNQYTIGTSLAFAPAVAATTYTSNSLVISGGVTYALTSDGAAAKMYRSPITSLVPPTWAGITAAFGLMDLEAAGGKLYAVGSDNGIYVFTEVLATAGPVQVGPVDKFSVQINVETGLADAVVFQWTAVPGSEFLGVTYELQIALDSAFTQVIWKPTTLAVTNVIDEDFQANTTYYWRVRVSAPADSPWSATRSFRIEALAPLKLVSPASGAQAVSVLPTFVWSAVRDATEYQIIVSDRENFDIITFSHNTAQAVYAVTEDEQLAYNTVYYWRVRASKPDVVVTTYVTGIFTTEQKPVPPTPGVTVTQPADTTFTITVPPSPEVIPAYLLWIIIGIGAILVIALIVLIVRTRRAG